MDETTWHKWNAPIWPRRTIDSTFTKLLGLVWRRRKDSGRWEYRQFEEVEDKWACD